MEWLYRLVIAALLVLVLNAVLRETAPGFSLVLILAGAAFLLASVVSELAELRDFYRRLIAEAGIAPEYLAPVVKCAAIAAVTRLGSDLCRDGGVTALSSGIEMAGTAAAFIVSLPLISTVFDAILDSL